MVILTMNLEFYNIIKENKKIKNTTYINKNRKEREKKKKKKRKSTRK